MAFNIRATRLWTWGRNQAGGLGDNTIAHKSSPVQTVAGGTNWRQMDNHSLWHAGAIKTDGTLWMWGSNNNAQLGDYTRVLRSSPVQTIAGGNNWKQVSIGGVNTAAIKTDGTLWCWGENWYGHLGDNTIDPKSSPVQTVAGGTNWKTVSCGYNHTAAIKTDGTLWLWGYDVYGQLGDNSTTKKSSPVQTVAGGTNWKQVSCGYGHTGAIKTDGTLWTWGNNSYFEGMLGDNTTLDRSSPVQTVAGGTNWKQVAAGYTHTSAIKTDGTLWTWGTNSYGNVGDNTTIDRSSPVQTIAGGNNWKYVSLNTAMETTVALKTDGTLWAWGSGSYGNVGDNTIINKSSPVQTIAGGNEWIVATDYDDNNPYQTSLGLIQTSTPVEKKYIDKSILFDLYPSLSEQVKAPALWACGYNGSGQLGDNTYAKKSSPVQTVAGGTNWKQAACGYSFNAVIKTDGTLWTWGNSQWGQLGQNSVNVYNSSPAQTVCGGNNWKSVSANQHHWAAIKTDGTLWVCGSNDVGQLGDNNVVTKSSPVQTICGGTNWKQTACGNKTTLAIKTDGTLWTWGQNNGGQLGDNTTIHKSSPVQTVAGGTNWKQVASGSDSSLAIKTDGTLWLWGFNTDGTLGDNTSISKSSPVQTVSGGTNWKYASCGYGYHNMAIKTDGTLWTWGFNNQGQLGDGTFTKRSSPVQTIAGGTNWKSLSFGGKFSAGIKTDGTLWTWGTPWDGQLGDNGYAETYLQNFQLSPAQTVMGGTNWKQVACGYAYFLGIAEDNPFL